MKPSPRILITAATLAALAMLGLAATATASVPNPPDDPQHPATVEPGTGPQPGHGAQHHHDANPATASPSPSDRTTSADSAFAPPIAVLAVILVGLLVGLTGATWLRRRHRRPAVV